MINNTSEDPAAMDGVLLTLLADGADGAGRAIEAMEARGQAELVRGDQLPTDSGGQDAAFVALGFEFGPPTPGDPLFRPAKLPAGWTRRADEHPMWSTLVDQHGRPRVSIFYKAAFYDRRADMSIITKARCLTRMIDAGTRPVYDDWLGPEEALQLLVLRRDTCHDDIAAAKLRASERPAESAHWSGEAKRAAAAAAHAQALIYEAQALVLERQVTELPAATGTVSGTWDGAPR